MREHNIGKVAGLLVAAAIWAGASMSANASLYFTPAGATDTDGPVNATASISLGNGTVTIILTDLQANPISSGQTLSGISFSVSGISGAATLASSSGNTSTINADGTYTAGVNTSPLPHWGVASGVNLSTIGIVGAQPYDLIIGPDSAGGFSGAGLYSSANKGLPNFNPYVLGSATFTINVPGVTPSSTLSGVAFEFGTQPEYVTAVPEPTTILAGAGALGLLLLGAAGARRSKVIRIGN